MRSRNYLGFTLIEILIVVALMGILTASGFVGYNTFNKNHTLLEAQNDLVNVLNTAKLRAQNQSKDSRCDDNHTITYWYVETINATPMTQYQLAIQCIDWTIFNPNDNSNGAAQAFNVKTYTLPKGLSFASPYQVSWFPVYNLVGSRSYGSVYTALFWQNIPVTTPSSIIFQITDGSTTKTVGVYQDGRIIPDVHTQQLK